MKNNKTYIILLLLGFFYSCGFVKKDKPLLIVNNNTKDVLYVYYSSEESIQLQPELELVKLSHYSYTDENGNNRDTVVYPENRVESFSKTYFYDDGVHTDRKFRPYSDQNYVNFFFIKESTMKNFTWKDIVLRQLYEKKVKYTYDELNKMNYEISYNP